MKRSLLLLTLLLLLKLTLNAQHCPFDMEAIIVLNIHMSGDTSIIPGLKVTLLDSLGNTVMTPKWDFSMFLPDTLQLWQNPSHTTFKGEIDCNHAADPTKLRFPFAKDNYVLMCPVYFPVGKYKIKVEDIDGRKNGGYFITTVLQLTKGDIYPLCGVYKMEEYPEEYDDQTYNYKPIEITLILQ